ncbi:PIN-like domain-containing protein [Flavobacterium sp. J27]|uniref:PIN-like domain-containing protein n=1 Tax=Flavobacterium sp. J27 TaxID=2060419 RepID=UPI0010313449|nr:PIN-like domain-containing protein [Flavobacterium sp. J27]
MNKANINPYKLSDEKEAKLWKEAIFVFDSSAILDFYFLPKSTREKIYSEVFQKLNNRLWMPFQVEYEYLKNREAIIKKPIKEKYEPLKSKIKKFKEVFSNDIGKRLEEVARETHKDDKHPHIDQSEINTFKSEVENFSKQINSFQEKILKQIETVEKEISECENNDDVLKALEANFKVGREYSFNEIIEISLEGKHRYDYKIPPGYGDFYNNEKKGTQIFGDLILWKQILEFSKSEQLPILFITNDIKKDEDWCYLDKKATEDRILSPREELIKEIKDHSSVDFWMYNLPQFLFNANNFLSAEFKEETIQNLYQFLNEKDKYKDFLKIKCNNCNKIHQFHKSELDLDFDCIGSSERSMGAENQYEAIIDFECDCGNDITVTFELWEYPVGIHNYDSIEVENGELLESFYFTIDFFEDDEYFDDSIRCMACDGDRNGMGNQVHIYNESDLVNEFEKTNPNAIFTKVNSGECDWCGTLHIECAKCNSVNSLLENQEIECEGGCGLTYSLETFTDRGGITERNLKLLKK